LRKSDTASGGKGGRDLSRIIDALRRAESDQREADPESVRRRWDREREFRVVTVTSNKGGVGKTTIAANLAAYIRALREDDPVLVLGFDDQPMLDRIFEIDPSTERLTIATGLAEGNLKRVVQFGQYGVEYVPASRDVPALRALLSGSNALRRTLLDSERTGYVVIDTKSDFEILTRSSIEIADFTIVVVKDQTSLQEAHRVFELLARDGGGATSAKILLSLMDLRVKYREGEDLDVMSHLISQIRSAGLPLFETFISRSSKVEALYTNPEGRAYTVLHAASQSLVHRQMHALASEILEIVG
jgi:cellulose biosynthesis protein BcsQ